MSRGNENEGGLDLNKVVGIIKVQNFVFFAFAYCTKRVYEGDDNQCQDDSKEVFLNRALWANLVVFIIILTGILITKSQAVQNFLNKCGAVLVTLQIFIFQGSLIASHFVFMFYSIQQHFFTSTTKCKDLQLFLMVYAYVSIVWIFLQIYEAILRLVYKMFASQPDYSLDNQGTEMENHTSNANYQRV